MASQKPAMWVDVLILVGVSLLVRLLYVLHVGRVLGLDQFSDFLFMHELAASLAAGDGFTIAGLRIFNQSVGYPAVLAIFYWVFTPSVAVALGVNCLLGAVAVALIYSLARRYPPTSREGHTAAQRQFALCCAGLAIFYPDALLYSGLVASENLLIPLVLLLVTINTPRRAPAQESGRQAITAGLWTGGVAALAASVKANILIYCLFLPAQWLLSRRRWLVRTVTAALVAACLLAPWTVLNYRASNGHLIPFSAVAGTAFLDGTNPAARGKPTNQYTLDIEQNGSFSEIELNALRFEKALAFIKAQPVAFIRLVTLKFLHSFSPARDFVFEYAGAPRLFGTVASRWLPTLVNAVLLTGVLLLLILGDSRSMLWRNGLHLLGSAVLLQSLFFAYSRYRYPFLFALLPQCVAGWQLLVARCRRGDARDSPRAGA